MGEIILNLDVSNVNKLCSICDSFDFDVNVICGRKCVDGKSVLGVMEMCGHKVVLAPVTTDDHEREAFFRRVKKIGAFKGGFL